MFRLRLFGGARIENASGEQLTGRAAQRRRLALLTVLALEHPRPVSRDRLTAWLWPEHETERARHLLRDSLYLLRGVLREETLASVGDELRLHPEQLRCDVWEFEEALAQGRPEAAIRIRTGPPLDGFHAGGAPELEQWLDAHRERLARSHARALEQLAEAASAAGEVRAAVEWWRQLAAAEPYSARVTRRLMQALDAAGDRAGAIQQARIHTLLLEQEFGAEPDPEVTALAEALRLAPDRAAAPTSPDLEREVTSAAEAADVGDTTPDAPAAPRSARTMPRRRAPSARVVLAAGAGVALVAIFSSLLLLRGPDARARPALAASAPSPKALAVLPCANLSGDPAQEYFSDGLTEELTGVLAQVRSLRVSARTSAFAFKGANRDIRSIARTLGVGTVLECSVRRVGERIRVTAQLINAADGFHLWAETYEREGTDLFAIQSDLAFRVASALEATLTPGERARLTRRPTGSVEAHALYQKGRHFWNQRTPGGYARAIDYYERAIAVDPDYAEAYAGLATVYSMQGIFGTLTPAAATEKTKRYALRALELDADLAEAHTVLGGYYQAHAWDSQGAEREHRRALELNPNSSTAHFWYGNFLSAMGRHEEAIAHKRKAVELDPLSPQLTWAFGITLLVAGRQDEALAQFRTGLELDSLYRPSRAGIGLVHEARGQLAAAVEYYRPSDRVGLARALGLLGRTAEARRILAELESDAARTGVYAPWVATVFAAVDDVDGAIDWLERSYAQRHPSLRFLGGPAFVRLERDPRYRELRRRVGLP